MLKYPVLPFLIGVAFFATSCTDQTGGNVPSIILPASMQQKEEKAAQDYRREHFSEQTDQDPHDTQNKSGALSAKQIAGVWQAKIGDMQCQISTSRTKSGKGFRAAAMLCPPSLSSVKYWQIEDDHLLFYDKNDQISADLTLEGQKRFSGKTARNEEISLWR